MRYEAILAGIAVLFAVSTAFAVYSWARRGFCADMMISASVAALSLGSFAVLAWRTSVLRKAEALSKRPVFLVMRSGPVRDGSSMPEVPHGKMPQE